MGGGSAPTDGMSRDNRHELNKGKFRQARNDPRLMRGNLIDGAMINCRTMQATDKRTGLSLKLGAPTGNNAGYFMLYVGDAVMHGQADPLGSDDGYERIFLLSELTILKGSIGSDQLQPIADMIATLQNHCTAGRTRQIASFILLEETEASRG